MKQTQIFTAFDGCLQPNNVLVRQKVAPGVIYAAEGHFWVANAALGGNLNSVS